MAGSAADRARLRAAKRKHKGVKDSSMPPKKSSKRNLPEKPKKKKAKKAKKPKKKFLSSSSSGSSEVASSSSSSSSLDSSSSDDYSSPDKKKLNKKALDMDLLEVLWPREDRPDILQDKKKLKGLSMTKLMKMKELYEKEQTKKGLGTAVHGKDKLPSSTKFAAAKDNCTTKLHPARFLCMPLVEPKEYWNLVPTGRSAIYRHLPLQHLGVDDVPEATVVKLHDRKVPVELDALARDVKDVKQAQLAVHAYVIVMRVLHPIDMGPAVLQLVLAQASYGEGLGDNAKNKLLLIKRFFEEAVRENCGRAVRKEPPMSFEQAQAKWVKLAAAQYPHLGISKLSTQLAAMGGATNGKSGQQASGGPKKAGGGAQQQAAKPNQGKLFTRFDLLLGNSLMALTIWVGL